MHNAQCTHLDDLNVDMVLHVPPSPPSSIEASNGDYLADEMPKVLSFLNRDVCALFT